jgi:hypothetical protein
MNSNQHEASNIAEYDGHNFSFWKLGLFVLLEEHGLIDVVTGDELIPEKEFEDNDEEEDPTNLGEIQEWKRKDCKARDYILKTTKKAEQGILVDCTTANHMWNLLTAQHRERSFDNQHDLLARFYDYKKQGRSQYEESHCRHQINRPSVERSWVASGCQRSYDEDQHTASYLPTLCVVMASCTAGGSDSTITYISSYARGKRECQVDTSTNTSRQHQLRVCPSTMRQPLVDDSSRYIKKVVRAMELMNNVSIRRHSKSIKMVHPIPIGQIIKGEVVVLVVAVVEAIKETKRIAMEMEVISLSNARIAA